MSQEQAAHSAMKEAQEKTEPCETVKTAEQGKMASSSFLSPTLCLDRAAEMASDPKAAAVSKQEFCGNHKGPPVSACLIKPSDRTQEVCLLLESAGVLPHQQEAESLGCGLLFGKRHQEPRLSVCIQAVCAAAPVGVA
ncbi:hypothetical protein U0070_021672 [Myodes glareolus]|uniref:Uncharacterized protein n=1 Tax=Myodes glareolus TaxID=447135 RepID=A0AAW0IQ51_MYOGA